MYLWLTLPFYLLILFFRILFAPFARNAIKGPQPVGQRKAAISKDFSLPALKKACLSLDCSLNDLCLSATSIAVKKYFEQHADPT